MVLNFPRIAFVGAFFIPREQAAPDKVRPTLGSLGQDSSPCDQKDLSW